MFLVFRCGLPVAEGVKVYLVKSRVKFCSYFFALGLLIDASRTNICDWLHRLYRQRLIDRQPVPREEPGRPRYKYAISKRGQERLVFWQSKTEKGN